MSEFVKNQAEVRNNLVAQMREVIDLAESEKRGLSAEDLTKIERLEADIEARDNAIATAEKVEARAAAAAEAASNFTPSTQTARQSDADLLRAIARGEVRGHEFNKEARSALVPSADTVGESFYGSIFDALTLVGPMLRTSQVFNTASGEALVLPYATANSTATVTSAGAPITESEPTLDSLKLQVAKYGAISYVANELISDAGFDIAGYIARELGIALGVAANSALTDKLVTQADAIVNGAGLVPTYEEVIDLVYGINAGARAAGSLGFQASAPTIAALRKLQDGSGRYIWTDSAVAGQPATLLGYTVHENPAIATGSGDATLLFGALDSFKVQVAGGVAVSQSMDFKFNEDVTSFRGVIRVDGGLVGSSNIGSFVAA